MPAIDTTKAPEGALQTHEYGTLRANPAYALRGRNHRRSQGVVHVRRTKEALVCRWRQSPVTGRLECVWGIERIAAPPIENPTPVSGDLNRHRRRIELRKISMLATALILIGVGGWSMRTAPRVDASTAGAIYPLGLMTNAKNLPEAHYVDYTFVFN